MGKQVILEKLEKVLSEEHLDEYKVVYILTKIRKYLEINNIKTKYKVLNFYCNWALHTKISRTEPVSDILKEFNNGDTRGFSSFKPFFDDMIRFLKNNSLPLKILEDRDKISNLMDILLDIYFDTPLEFYPEDKKLLIIKKPKKLPDGVTYGVDYEIW